MQAIARERREERRLADTRRAALWAPSEASGRADLADVGEVRRACERQAIPVASPERRARGSWAGRRAIPVVAELPSVEVDLSDLASLDERAQRSHDRRWALASLALVVVAVVLAWLASA